MLILGLDFSSPQRSVALVDSAGDEPQVLGMVSDHGARGARPLPLIQELLRRVNLPLETVQGVAVGLGPGSYTGIRSAISIAEGWRLARKVTLAGVSSVESLARQAVEQGWSGDMSIAIDAQRGEVYLARYRIVAGNLERVEPLRLLGVEALRGQVQDSPAPLVGPEVSRWSPSGKMLFPEAGTVARLAIAQLHAGRTETLQPIYLRETTFVKIKPRRIPLDQNR